MDDVIIDFVANTEGLKPVIQYLHQIGQITDEQVKDFEQMNKLYADRSKRIADERTQLKGASRDMSDLAKSAQEVNKAIAGKAMEEATKKMVEYGKEVENVTKKYTSAKQELKELTKLITSNQLAGEQLKAAKERAAELTDQISDARGEIAAMASDTRKFDLLVEGIRGVTAAFSVATSAQALFGEENEEVQKALLKVQAAMALATSTQELMKIATRSQEQV
jgi:vacuolar-type H+-ATPase subunit I/STV1